MNTCLLFSALTDKESWGTSTAKYLVRGQTISLLLTVLTVQGQPHPLESILIAHKDACHA